MKKLLKALLLAALLVSSFLLITACGEKDEPDVPPAQTAPKTYRITFDVDGMPYSVVTEAGKIPEFTGSTEKAGDSEGYYTFKGWDKELAPANEKTTYTAVYEYTKWKDYTVKFVYKTDGDRAMTVMYSVKENNIPNPPEYPNQYKTNEKIFTFANWSLDLVPVTDEFFTANKKGLTLVYTAEYTDVDRYYDVNFISDDKVLYTDSVKYNGIPEYKGEEIKIPEGYNYHYWLGRGPVVNDDAVCELIFTYNDPEQLEWAYSMNLMSFTPSLTENDNRGNILGEASAVLYMALEVRNTPDLTYSKRYRDRAVESLEFMVSDEGDAPFFDLEPYWCYAPLTAAIATCQSTPSIWTALSIKDVQKYDIVMRSFAYILTLGTADGNNYSTGPGLQGNFGKAWNPNYRLANYIPMLFVGQYFGGAKNVDALLITFSYDLAVADFQRYPCFDRAYNRWTTVPVNDDGSVKINPATNKPYPTGKDFMENGGSAYIFKVDNRLGYTGTGQLGGSGVGVRTNYTAGGKTVDDVDGIMSVLLNYTFSGGAVWSDSKALGADGIYPSTADSKLVGTSKAYIAGGLTSPYEGMQGLMLEFNAGDAGTKVDGIPTSEINGKNIRSSCTYNLHNFIMIGSSIAALESLGVYDCNSEENKAIYSLMWVGLSDLLFKYENGYQSYSLGEGYFTKEGENNDGYYAWKYWWNTNYAANNPSA